MYLSIETVEIFIDFLKDLLLKENDHQILTNFEPEDYKALSKLPDQFRVKFFEVLTLEMPKDFSYQAELGLKTQSRSVVTDLNQINFKESIKTQVLQDIFSDERETAKPVRMFPLAMKRYKVGSD